MALAQSMGNSLKGRQTDTFFFLSGSTLWAQEQTQNHCFENDPCMHYFTRKQIESEAKRNGFFCVLWEALDTVVLNKH